MSPEERFKGECVLKRRIEESIDSDISSYDSSYNGGSKLLPAIAASFFVGLTDCGKDQDLEVVATKEDGRSNDYKPNHTVFFYLVV